MKSFRIRSILLIISTLSLFLFSCENGGEPKSDSGVSKAHTTVQTDAQGQTAEQRNIIDRLKRDNEIGSIKHLYIISSYTGDVMQYSTVNGKVTSGNKRLTPKTVDAANGISSTGAYGNYVTIGQRTYLTDEVLDDGGSYGDSGNYLFWFDAQGNYHQYYPAGGTYLHISDKPLRIKKANFTLELMDNTLPKKVDPPSKGETLDIPPPLPHDNGLSPSVNRKNT